MAGSTDFTAIPIVDVSPLISGTGDRAATIARLDDACHRCGCLYVTGDGIDVILGFSLRHGLAQNHPRAALSPLAAKIRARPSDHV